MPRDLRFDNLQQLIDEVQRLRRGYTQEGNWNLGQICHHIHLVPLRWLGMPAQDDAPETDLQKQYKPYFAGVLASRKLPGKIDAPPQLVPPADVPEQAIDDFLGFVRERISQGFPAINHRLFGNLSPDQCEQMMLIHSAHHLAFLTPTGA